MNKTSFQKDINIFLNQLIEKAISMNASDIHIDPKEKRVDVRLRISGILHESGWLESQYLDLCIGKLKVLAELRSDVHDKAQDGRFYYISEKLRERIDVRVSIAPTFYGENCVMRLLRPELLKHRTFAELGMTVSQSKQYTLSLKKSSGLIIVAGPTGSGKSTTLQVVISSLITDADGKSHVITVEDPPEYTIFGWESQIVQHKDVSGKNISKEVKDEEGNYLYCNVTQAKSLGIETKDIIGKTDYDFFTKETNSF